MPSGLTKGSTWRCAALRGSLIVVLAVPMLSAGAPPPRWILVYAAGASGHGLATYTVDDFTRLITEVDSTGQSRSWLMSGAIMLQLFAPSGHNFEPDFGGTPADGADWTAYLDSLFAESGVFKRLDSAVALATGALGPPPAPFQVSVMVPYAGSRDTPLDFLGTTYELRRGRGRRDAAVAYINETVRRFQAAGLRGLVLDGFYWMHELVPHEDAELVADVARVVHAKGLRLLWIPYWNADGWDQWRTFGFDEAWLQPNYFFNRSVPATRLDSAVARAQGADIGLEVEFDGRVLHDLKYTDRLNPYLAALGENQDLRERSIAVYDGGGALVAFSRVSRLPALVRYQALCRMLRR